MKNYMLEALKQAEKASKKNEVPIGAVLVLNNKIIAKAFNKREKTRNVLAHAEVLVLQKGSKKIKDWRFDNCELYVTLEPCKMCTEILKQARIKKVYFGSKQMNNIDQDKLLDFEYKPNDCCENIIKEFFKSKRKK
ncbi:MAG: nucleoside deaminase [Mollicutes bacterium]|nr:nucleoside deaminase [Mollicutes bacterium]